MKRINLKISKSAFEVLEKLQRDAGLSDTKEVINYALAMLDWAVEQKKNGKEIVVLDKDGNIGTRLHLLESDSSEFKDKAEEKHYAS